MANQQSSIFFWQTHYVLPLKKRGFHLVTAEIEQATKDKPYCETGIMNLFLQHTSASILISENACKDVALDLESYFTLAAPDDNTLYRHTLEGEDDMPAHIKNAMLGVSINIPLFKNQMQLGQWQGIYLCEHRNHASHRHLVITVQGTPHL